MRLSILGAYLPRLSPERLAAWVKEDVKEFVDGIRELQQRGLAQSWSDHELRTRAEELPQELESSLNAVALFEMFVQDHHGEFDPFSTSEKETTSVAWEPAFLSVDGQELIGAEGADLRTVETFRVAFYIHDWPEKGVLVGPCGELPIPRFEPVPERLWTLAPYVQLD
jgi:hypothetical protein